MKSESDFSLAMASQPFMNMKEIIQTVPNLKSHVCV